MATMTTTYSSPSAASSRSSSTKSSGTHGSMYKETSLRLNQLVKSEHVQELLDSHIPFTWHLGTFIGKGLAALAFVALDLASPIIVLVALDLVLMITHVMMKYEEKKRIRKGKVSAAFSANDEVQDHLPETRHRSGAVCAKRKAASDESQSTATTSSLAVHVAGSSTTRCNKGVYPQPAVDIMSWQDAVASKFKLRIGPDYKKTNAKAPSAEALYELIGLDVLRCTKDRLCNIASRSDFVLPAWRSGVDPAIIDIRKAEVPRLFIVNAQIPDKAPSIMGGKRKGADDPGYSMIFYFTVKQQVIDQLLVSPDTCSPAVKLLHKYVHEHDKNPDIRRRFKAIGMADMKDLGIPGVGTMIDKFNGKPAIINKVAEIYSSGADWDWLEIDISIYDFPFLAQKALSSLKDRVSEIGLRAGFVFQGETDEELPEVLIGGGECVRVQKNRCREIWELTFAFR